MKAREVKRAKLVAKYAAKRAQLKAEGNYEALQALPKNASPRTSAQPLQHDGSSQGICASSASLVSSSVRWLLPVSSPG